MPFVSKKPLKKEVRKQLDQQFIKTVVSLQTISGGSNFLSEFLTETEQMMFAKRLMIIFMLIEGISQYRIKQVLHVSSSTVSRIAKEHEQNVFPHIARICGQKKHREVLWRELEVMIRMGMPSMGRDRWKWLDELYK